MRERTGGTKLALLLSSIDANVQVSIITPLVASIAMAYADAASKVSWVISITALTMVIFSFVSNVLVWRFDKKKVLVAGTALFAAGGLMTVAANSMSFLLFARAVVGIGAGLAFPLVPTMIAVLFTDAERAKLMGWQNSLGAFLGFVISAFAGFIALINWKYAFLIYLMFIPIVILQILFIPGFKPEREEAAGSERQRQSYRGLGAAVWVIVIFMFAHAVFFLIMPFSLSILIEQFGIGTSALSGIANATQTVIATLTSAAFLFIFKKAKKYSLVIALAALAASLFLMSAAQNAAMIIGCMVLFGFGVGICNPFLFTTLSAAAPEGRMTSCMSLLVVGQLLAQVVEPFYISALSALGFAVRGQVMVSACCFIILFVVALAAMVISPQSFDCYMLSRKGE